ncbi:MAG: hypothetical protein JST26_04425 [Bacteroidetes bacterium]|nr:hypothetical protein [Bacteroidota bacterium]
MKKQFVWLTCLVMTITGIRAQGTVTVATTPAGSTVQAQPTNTLPAVTNSVATTNTMQAAPSATVASPSSPAVSKPYAISVIMLDCKKPDFYTPYSYINVHTTKEGYTYAIQHKDSLRLLINGIWHSTIKPLYFNIDDTSVVFKMNYDTAQASPWKIFYAFPNYWEVSHPNTGISMGFPKSSFMSYSEEKVELRTSSYLRIIIAYAIFILIIVIIWNRKLWKYNKSILRDIALYSQNGVKINNLPTSIADGTINYKEVPFSMARSQFFMWLMLIFLGILHIWGFTSILTEPTGSVLILLGISGGTFYIGKVIDVAPAAGATTVTPQQAVTDFVNGNKKSKGFVNDILYDGNSICLHRLQLFMFTVFLGIYFLCSFYTNLALPSFSTTMMTLMGISSVTYAGVKTTES